MVTESDARALAAKSAKGLNLKLSADPAHVADDGGLAFHADAPGSDLDSGWIVVRDNGDREFTSIPPYVPAPDYIVDGPKVQLKK